MTHTASLAFWTLYDALPARVRTLAEKNFGLLKQDPRHPSLHFKSIGCFCSVRVGAHYRALAVEIPDGCLCFWIGLHVEYDHLVGERRLELPGPRPFDLWRWAPRRLHLGALAPQLNLARQANTPPSRALEVLLKPIPVLLASWFLAGFGAVIGSILGNAAGKPGLFAGAVVGGILGVGAAVAAVIKLQWLASTDRRSAFVGGVLGFGVAAPIAVTHLHTPVTPLLICGLAGVGLLLGVGVAHWRRGSS